jgi:tetratricopeptide (TPR) repeat protein
MDDAFSIVCRQHTSPPGSGTYESSLVFGSGCIVLRAGPKAGSSPASDGVMVQRISERVHFGTMSRTLNAVLFASLGALAACGPALHGAVRSPTGSDVRAVSAAAQVSDEDFARSAYKVLLNGASTSEQSSLLAGVVRRQLARAGARFDARKASAGLDAFRGAMYLVRAGQQRVDMFHGMAPTLRAAAKETARLGNEGQARAVYSLLAQTLPAGPELDDVKMHLAALGRWTAGAPQWGPLRRAGERERLEVQQALIEGTDQALDRAATATVDWMHLAMKSDLGELPIDTPAEREEALEAYRAIRAGGATLVGLYIRHGRPRDVLELIDREELTGIVPRGPLERLRRAADEGDPEAWAGLYSSFDAIDESESLETSLEVEVARAAAWGAALELFRAGPGSLEAAKPLAQLLVEQGMAEVAPLVLSSALAERPQPRSLSWCLGLVLNAMLFEDEAGQLQGARRTFEAAEPLLEIAVQREYRSSVHPSVGHVRYVMGALELKAAHPDRAQPLLESATSIEPTTRSFFALAAIHRQRQDNSAALEALDSAAKLARRANDPAEEAEAALASFEIHRAMGRTEQAQARLSEALRLALDARQLSRTDAEQATAERVLARVLSYYRDSDGARRATQRAYAASRSTRQLTATVLDAAKRALTDADLGAARNAVIEAMQGELADEDLVYVALWLHLLQQKLKVPSDGTVEAALATVRDASGWPATLRDWASGQLGDDGLVAAARGQVQKTEAEFYTAMRAFVTADGASALPRLEQVAKSEAVELVEVAIARELLVERKGRPVRLELPRGLAIP